MAQNDEKPEGLTALGGAQYRGADERREQGKALRKAAPRQDQAMWNEPDGRADPVGLLEKSNEDRLPELIPIRFGRMSQSPFAFYRGGAALMAADLASTPNSGLRVQACGDAHLMNFGGFATPERNIVFDINDLDETLPAPWEWDLKRLAASVVIAARHIGLSESDTGRLVIDTVRTYRDRMHDYGSMHALDVWYAKITVEDVIKRVGGKKQRGLMAKRIEKARIRSTPNFLFPKLVEEQGTVPRIADDPPLIFHPTAEQAPGLESAYKEQFAQYRKSLPDHVRSLFDRYTFCDFALKVVGVGSVGTISAIALFLAADDDPIFLQIKEAKASVLEPYAGKSEYKNHGQRVVMGQHLMQSASDIFLGWTTGENKRHFYLRQLRDVKISAVVEGFDLYLMQQYAGLCAWALARAHARSGDAATIAGYMGSSETFDDAIGEFGMQYADQNQRDYRRFIAAIKGGRIPAQVDL
jgi:uncharacterized protein (DUF2252 family)